MPRNTESWFVAQTIKQIKRVETVDFLVSYADPSRGHEGVIYRAGNWQPDGRTDQERKSPRIDYVALAPDKGLFGSHFKHYARRSHAGVTPVSRVARNSKNRFVMMLNEARRAGDGPGR